MQFYLFLHQIIKRQNNDWNFRPRHLERLPIVGFVRDRLNNIRH